MTQIKNSVGAASLNNKVECAYIQILLNIKLAKTQGFTKLVEDGLCGTNTIKAIRTFQQTLAKLYHVDGRIDADKHTFKTLISGFSNTELTTYWNQAVKSQNTGLISDEQVKRAQAKNQVLPEKLLPTEGLNTPSNTFGYQFPLGKVPQVTWQAKTATGFGWIRDDGSRLHAACDLVMPSGEPVYAIADGEIIRMSYFYEGTYAVEIKHATHIARYGELLPSSGQVDADRLSIKILPHIKVGNKDIKKGQLIGYVGKLYSGSAMLHFELYNNPNDKHSLTNKTNGSPYKRRLDLANPTEILNSARSSLPTNKEANLDPKTLDKLIIETHALTKTRYRF